MQGTAHLVWLSLGRLTRNGALCSFAISQTFNLQIRTLTIQLSCHECIRLPWRLHPTRATTRVDGWAPQVRRRMDSHSVPLVNNGP